MICAPNTDLHWQIFCRVIDNHGDLGVCWRLAHQLQQRGQTVTLWVDDASALAWMAPNASLTVAVHSWPQTVTHAQWPDHPTVVVEAFGCELPECVHIRVSQHTAPLVWLNLEYLSAEPFVQRSHGLASPVMSGSAAGRSKWFFYPGFTANTGGLLQDTATEHSATLDALGLGGQTEVSVFCYENPTLKPLIQHFQAAGWRVWCLPGKTANAATSQGANAHQLPYLAQTDFDTLLKRCAFNVVRGEDSLTRALWSGRPFLWHIYPQSDGAHAVKLEAFLDCFEAPAVVRSAHLIWNGLQPAPEPALERTPGLVAWLPEPESTDWQTWVMWAEHAKTTLLGQRDLVSQLQDWAHTHA